MRTFRTAPAEDLLDICEAFLSTDETVGSEKRLKQRTTKEVAEIVTAQWKARGRTEEIKREEVYAAIIEARRRGLFHISAPPHHGLKDDLCRRFGLDPDCLRVAATESRHPDHVAGAAAKLILSLILDVGAKKLRSDGRQDRVRIGFGAGWTTRVVAYQLALSMRTASDLPPIGLHATSSGFAVEMAQTAPVTFFGFFEGVTRDIKEIGMFGPPYVADADWKATMARRGVAESVKGSSGIDIVVTSLAAAHDPHSGLRSEARKIKGVNLEKKRDQRGWVGDVQHLPYSDAGPILDLGHRPVTLFDLEGLATIARHPKKHVVLVAPPCPVCERTRARALAPLLSQKSLAVWTHLVTDIPTARDLLAPSS
jgi:hypothetical protein